MSDLRKYGKLVFLDSNFVISDRDDWSVSLSAFSPLLEGSARTRLTRPRLFLCLVRRLSTLPASWNAHPLRSLAVIKRLLPSLPIPAELRKDMKPNTWLEHISKCKSRMQSPEQFRAERAGQWDQQKVEAIATVYECVLCTLGEEEELAGR